MEEYRLKIANMSKSFPGVKALDNVNLKVEKGEAWKCTCVDWREWGRQIHFDEVSVRPVSSGQRYH